MYYCHSVFWFGVKSKKESLLGVKDACVESNFFVQTRARANMTHNLLHGPKAYVILSSQ